MTATITLAGNGLAHAQRFEMNLASGMAHVPTTGEVIAEKLPGPAGETAKTGEPDLLPAQPRMLSWSDRADFKFALNEKHEVTPVIAEVHASGDARATDGRAALKGESLIALFKPVNPKASRLDRLQIAGGAIGEDGKGGNLHSDTLDIAFVPTEGKPEQSDPSLLTAQGSVQAARTGSTLLASFLQANIGRAGEGKLDVTHVTAKQANFENADGVHAKAEVLDADPIANTVHLTGAPGQVEVAKEGTTVTGSDITLAQAERKMTVQSAGTLIHDGPLSESTSGSSDKRHAHVDAHWSREMVFEDAKGAATCLGDVQAVVTRAPGNAPGDHATGAERDTANAEEVHLTFTPAPDSKKKDEAKAERRLLTVQAVGSDMDKPATVESRRYAAGRKEGEEPNLEQLQLLRSLRINLDNDKGTLDTPGAGTMFNYDVRSGAAKGKDKDKPKQAGALDAPSNGSGSTSFKWTGSMSMDRPTGVVHLNDHVTVLHRDDEKAPVTELDCEELTAHFRELSEGANPDSFSGELTSADAEGAVWVSSGQHELLADSVHYDAVKKNVSARAVAGNRLTIIPKDGRDPFTAESVEWDLANDRMDAKKPGPVMAPVSPRR
jgi:lipopolysaccharide export system protein LptA